jgi:hypothetical protein
LPGINTLANRKSVNYDSKKFYSTGPGANVIKLFSAVIYCLSMVIQTFCVRKQYYLGNYHGIAVNYHGIALKHWPIK